MLSFLIPTYNNLCIELAIELSAQITACGIVAEVIVMDDGSTNMNLVAPNEQINQIAHCRFVRNTTNAGQATTRNLLAKLAQYPSLVFLDSDVFPTSPHFVELYAQHCCDADVVCGGIRYRNDDKHHINPLRLKFGLNSEVSTATQRRQHPYDKFTAANAMIKQTTMQRINFDSNIKQYGYEDVLFGQELQHLGITIAHIDNPVFHDDTDTNEQFLHKTQTSLKTLAQIANKLNNMSRIVNAYNTLQRLHLTRAMQLFFKVMRKPLETNLLGQKPLLFVFNIYKLGYYCTIQNR